MDKSTLALIYMSDLVNLLLAGVDLQIMVDKDNAHYREFRVDLKRMREVRRLLIVVRRIIKGG